MSAGPAPAGALALFLTALAVQRAHELALSARNGRALRARGARELGARHFPLIVAVHALFPACLAVEVLALGARPGPAWPLWLALVLAAQALRAAAMRALGPLWSVRVWEVPGQARVRRGPYRLLRHPAYLAVTLELLAAPLMFGAWRTAAVVPVLSLAALAPRIRDEEAALAGAAGRPPAGAERVTA